jgi:glutathione S-transferase
MILIGQYDSPFVRRVGIALTLYGYTFEHRPWSTFGDGDKIEPFNPLRRVPTLVLDSGATIIQSAYVLDWLDEQARTTDEVAPLIAASGPERQLTLYFIALSTGLADKAVALFYEQVLHKEQSPVWLERCQTQIGSVLDVLEKIRTDAKTQWLAEGGMTHADIALACALRFVREAHPKIDIAQWPALAFHSAQCEQMEVFKAISQPFIGPATEN